MCQHFNLFCLNLRFPWQLSFSARKLKYFIPKRKIKKAARKKVKTTQTFQMTRTSQVWALGSYSRSINSAVESVCSSRLLFLSRFFFVLSLLVPAPTDRNSQMGLSCTTAIVVHSAMPWCNARHSCLGWPGRRPVFWMSVLYVNEGMSFYIFGLLVLV